MRYVLRIAVAIIFTLAIGFLSIAYGATYYVSSSTGSDSNNGTTTGTPWAHCPGMVGWTGSGSLSAGDTVYFNSSDTWTITVANTNFLVIVGGVTYDGDTWGGGTRAPSCGSARGSGYCR